MCLCFSDFDDFDFDEGKEATKFQIATQSVDIICFLVVVNNAYHELVRQSTLHSHWQPTSH